MPRARRPAAGATSKTDGTWRPAVKDACPTSSMVYSLRVLGVDPDLHTTGLAAVHLHRVEGVWEVDVTGVDCTRVAGALKGQACSPSMGAHVEAKAANLVGMLDLSVVEGQTVRKDTPNVQSIVDLAQAAGACIGALSSWPVAVPAPHQWKGGVPKGIHQARVCKRLGWEFRLAGSKTDKSKAYCVPLNSGHDLDYAGDWKHVMDAVGLALWGADKLIDELIRKGLA